MLIKTGDKVRVISGKDRGQEGTVKKVISAKNRVVVEGVNKIKKHQKPTNVNPQGGIVDVEAPLDASNVMFLDPSTNEPTRLGVRREDGKRVRYAKKSGKDLEN
ncbi:50S ribosomal protein L24 [Lactiplantibacillus mudanjiangensis]|uniref:Large ribosomal subunit protein uL24 n=1 Tax=Lactiplantibacillus mudanjiangensis TaxID=1296538 RepID=A0A660E238_9LACO|nr:50S ribosomal protein L24 [Lactiplantibacillus mudanjiangensis]VDG17685.1 ribosomal protein L24 [Lactobacillus plantarum JDM1] [Lactiplantibacillus mudanjiangensis]VDG24907.1 ribosomal protein L24 [Lactobacillus plantarum JDM1] [Lactiplantibacillus mudanjiangensis]VDG29511.1 ribosomal protein L24 [Lactobacillus plantarum JDM1] [Lactiplantibacillus mudanjiangensis]VDG32625.1 ribosomal protein L24 [Lactobacillus plantarum JDM1] [Lactiplantibacillus mudanjiangensis]